MRRAKFALLLLVFSLVSQALASGPRFVTGPPFFTGPQGVAIGWKQPHLLYYTDPGDLSASVNHQAADALVAAAAAVWNVPVASITMAQGGTLAEHVNGGTVYLDSTGMVFPADVMSSNAAAIPLAILYDTDGSVTDTLLGAGASDPAGCRQNGVTESVDAFDPAGYITHAIIVLNGRCTGPAPEMQLQLRYQLMRMLGRVLGIAWSQTNDNVFTGSPTPTNVQALNWPIMHPIDILCGAYTYQCLPDPFRLRTDDIAGLVSVYAIEAGAVLEPGKQVSLAHAQGLEGWVSFPDGQGMSGVNVLVRRQPSNSTLSDAWYEGSAVSGAYFRQNAGPSFAAQDTSARGSLGATDVGQQGRYEIAYFPLIADAASDNLLTFTEPVNPLYTGEFALGPYAAGTVLPAGSPPSIPTRFVTTAGGRPQINITVSDAPPTCGMGGDGTFAVPMQAPASGWWNGLLCGYGHASYVTAAVRPGHTFTLEVTALDALGQATEAKAMPLIALFGEADTLGSAPSLGLTPSAFQSRAMGTTTLSAATAQDSTIKFGIADARGEGRPDFNYQARLFYADTVSPARVGSAGGTITILGSGFRAGNTVRINGIAAVALRWTANEIVVSVPGMATVHATDNVAVDVSVGDTFTGALSVISGGLTYDSASTLPDTMRTLSAPAGALLVDDAAPAPFAVQVLAADGVTPRTGEPVVFTSVTGSVRWSACGTAACTVPTDARGTATITVTPLSDGPVTLQATDRSLSQTVSFRASSQAGAMEILSAPEPSVRVGSMSNYWFNVQVLGSNGRGLAGRLVTFTVPLGRAQFDGCFTSVCSLVTDQWGTVGGSVMPLAEGPVTVMATNGDVSRTASFNALGNTDRMQIVSLPNESFFLGEDSGTFSVRLLQANWAPDPLRPIVFSASPGVIFGECGTNPCTMTANYNGQASTYIIPPSTGTFTVQAAYGDVLQSATFTVLPKTRHLNILSKPEDQVAVSAQAAQPFSVQFLENDGVTPVIHETVTLAGVPGSIRQSACPYNTCEVELDSHGIATTWITPLVPGTVALSASYEPFVTSTSFVAVGGLQTMHVVQQPGGDGAAYGVLQTVSVQVMAPDGVTPWPWDPITFTVTSGPFALVGAATASIQVYTDANGMASCTGVALGFGPVVMQATDGAVSLIIRFMAGSPPDVLKLVSMPADDSLVGTSAASAFVVRAFAHDGITPAANKTVVFTATAGSVRLGCGAAVCSVTTDVSGAASMTVTPMAAGVIGLLAVEGAATQAVSFSSVAPVDVMRLVSSPTSGGFAGAPASGTFAVQILQPDGVTPAAGRNVIVSVTNANASLGACAGTARCSLQTDSQGMISTQVTPLAPGPVTLLAADGAVTQTASFTASPKPDVLRLVSAPGATVSAGLALPTSFSVLLSSGDTGAPLPGRSIVFSTAGSFQFAGCTGLPCTVVTGADGVATAGGTPLGAGAYLLTATAGALSVHALFQAVARPDVMHLVSAPASGSYVGVVATIPFSVQVLLADGATPAAGRSINLTVTAGSAAIAGCSGGSTCSAVSDANGNISVGITPLTPGSVTLLAADGPTTQRATFTALVRADVMQVVSAPPATLPVGQANGGFAVKVTAPDGTTPRSGIAVSFTVAAGSARLGSCAGSACTLQTGLDGIASVTIMPLAPGPVTLTAASDGGLSVTVSFTGIVQPDLLRIISVPAAGSLVGQVASATFTVQALLADGVTPASGAPVTLSVAAGSASLSACGASACSLVADATGTVSSGILPLAAGTISLHAMAGPTLASAAFAAVDPPDLMLTVVAPAASVRVGGSVEFAVRVLAADGKTPRPGRAVTFSTSDSAAAWVGCSTSICQSVTGADGVAGMHLTTGTPGSITLRATAGALSTTANLQVLANVFSLTANPASLYVAEGVSTSVTLRASALKDDLPAATQAVTWSGSAIFQPAQSQSSTAADGTTVMAASLGPLSPNAPAQVSACAWTSICTQFNAFAVAGDQVRVALIGGATQQVSGTATFAPVLVQITDRAGHAVAGVAVNVYQTVTALDAACPDRGRCPAATVLASRVTVVNTDAAGIVSIVPLDMQTGAYETQLAFSAGTQGFVTAVLSHHP